jgi:ATP-dependent Clp protease adaptor protein ClpS
MKKEEPDNRTTEKRQKDNFILILFNDEINSFDNVIRALAEVCGHDEHQAEQCAMIAHFKGSCEVKIGSQRSLRSMSAELKKRKLKTKVERG